jgi:succinate--hydroxymethylglutarate CoA-transferase
VDSGHAIKFSDTKATIRSNPPLLGEHTEEILGEIGMSGSDIMNLRDLKII